VIEVLFLLSLIGVAIVSVAIGIVATHFVLNGLEALVLRLLSLRHPVRQHKTNAQECQRANNDEFTDRDNVPISPLNIRRCDLYEIIRSHIKKMLSDPIKNQCPNQKCNANTEEHHHYINHYPPRVTQHPLPSPIKHMRTILNKLRKGVNQSGQEPWDVEA
jgi:hypothetical protein